MLRVAGQNSYSLFTRGLDRVCDCKALPYNICKWRTGLRNASAGTWELSFGGRRKAIIRGCILHLWQCVLLSYLAVENVVSNLCCSDHNPPVVASLGAVPSWAQTYANCLRQCAVGWLNQAECQTVRMAAYPGSGPATAFVQKTAQSNKKRDIPLWLTTTREDFVLVCDTALNQCCCVVTNHRKTTCNGAQVLSRYLALHFDIMRVVASTNHCQWRKFVHFCSSSRKEYKRNKRAPVTRSKLYDLKTLPASTANLVYCTNGTVRR